MGIIAGISLLVLVDVREAYCDLDFFMALYEAPLGQEMYRKYDQVTLPADRVVLPGDLTPNVIYVRKKSALAINLGDIESVVLRRIVLAKDIDDLVARAFKRTPAKKSEEGENQERVPEEFASYEADLYLSRAAGRKVEAFVRAHQNQRFCVKLNGQLLSVVRIAGPVDSRGLSVRLLKNDRRYLEEIFSPVKGRVTWKSD